MCHTVPPFELSEGGRTLREPGVTGWARLCAVWRKPLNKHQTRSVGLYDPCGHVGSRHASQPAAGGFLFPFICLLKLLLELAQTVPTRVYYLLSIHLSFDAIRAAMARVTVMLLALVAAGVGAEEKQDPRTRTQHVPTVFRVGTL